ncbi:YadA-like family protein [Veillonella sp.]|uniref:YadA-like family protein n=1 Tax=Veillonella sp. TaxID=1926307 RepID=UPI001B4C2CEA|nr:YadA-like family protein [Veillonella sp.]MBP8616034.1 YadA-like family protein [Veillonella sp.]
MGGIAIGLNAAAKDGSISIGQQVQTGSTNIDRANQRGVTSVGDWTTVSAESIKAVGANGELGSVGALGSGNKADYALFSTMTGVGNSITGTATTDYTIKTDNVTNGYGGYSAYNNSVSGYRNAVTNSDNTLTIGSYNKISNGNENLVMGNFNKLTGTTANGASRNVIFAYNDGDSASTVNPSAGNFDRNAATTVNGDTITAGDTVTINNNGINMGDTKITNLQAGTISATSTDAVTGAQLYKTNQQVNQNTDSINKLTDRVGDLQDEVQDVGALGAALGALKPIQYDPLEPTQLMAGIGTYRSSSAVALGLAHYKNESTMFHAGVAFNNGSNGHLMANAGVTWKFGYRAHETAVSDRYRNGPISSAYALQDEVSALKDENLNLKERLQAEQQRNAEQDALIQSILSELKALKG